MRSIFFILPCLLVLTSCIQFTITEEEVREQFDKNGLVPELNILRAGDRNTHYASINQGRDNLIIFVHGSPGSWSAFIDYFKIDSLLEMADLLSIDRPGFGYSDRGEPEPSLEKQAYLLHQVSDLYDHETKILVGHSLGGPVIARMVMDYPGVYNGLLFLAPSVDPNLEKNEWYRRIIQTKVGTWLTPEDFWVSNEEIVPLKEELNKMKTLWSDIEIRSIVIQGTKDKLVPKENANFLSEVLNDSLTEIRMLQGADHFIPWNQHDKVVTAIFDLMVNP